MNQIASERIYTDQEDMELDWYDYEGVVYFESEQSPRIPVEGVLFVGVALIIIMGIGLILNHHKGFENPVNSVGGFPTSTVFDQGVEQASGNVQGDVAIIAPYDVFEITQDLHGFSYGHMAVDIAAGRGVPIKSPITGTITALYIDEYGNSKIIIENDVYEITMLHGEYAVKKGDHLELGQVVGVESNIGYTMDYFGNLCYGRVVCGNHTHLNIFDKRLQANVNPLDLIQ